MSVLLIDLALALIMSVAGLLLGWWLRSRTEPPAVEDSGDDARYTQEVLSRLKELAANVAANVDQHSSRVQEINDELTGHEVQETEAVLDAVSQLVRANEQMQEQLGEAEGKLKEQERLIESHAAEARTDALTGISNRRAFDDEIQRRHAEFDREGRPFCVMMLDVDHFKKFNDTHGHDAGDEVLRCMGESLKANARACDLPARYGGEEFAVVMANTKIEDAAAVADRVRRNIEAISIRYQNAELRVTASVGVSEMLEGESIPALVKRADACLYVSKDAGRNCTHWHDGKEIHGVTRQTAEEEPTLQTPETPPEPDPEPEIAPDPEPVSELEPTPEPKAASAPDKVADKAAEAADEGSKASVEDLIVDGRDGLCNRTAFFLAVGRRIAERTRGGPNVSVVMVKVDGFKDAVAKQGQQVGNMVLKATTQFLNAALRDMDLVAHYDTATFALLLPNAEFIDVIGITERLRTAISRCPLRTESGTFSFTVSAGAAEAMKDDDTIVLLKRAEESMDAAIRSGGNASFFHNGQWSETVEAALERVG